jgi:N-acetyl-gamma-glutamylphosphate reductase
MGCRVRIAFDALFCVYYTKYETDDFFFSLSVIVLVLSLSAVCLIDAHSLITQLCNFATLRPSNAMHSELYPRSALRTSTRIANPGCYATAAQLLLAPLLPYIKAPAWPTVFGISGYSGAGTVSGPNDEKTGRPTTVAKVTPESLGGAIKPYALTDHIHEREAGRHLSTLLAGANGQGEARDVKVAFTPSVAPWFSGILAVASIPLTTPSGSKGLSARDVRELFEAQYANERLVRLTREVPVLGDVEGKHGFVVGGFQVSADGSRVVVSGGLDNLLKGAATQCLQVCATCVTFWAWELEGSRSRKAARSKELEC